MNYKITRDNYKLTILADCKLVGKFGFPMLEPTQVIPTKLIAFNECFAIRNPQNYFVHFYIDDYQFERIWTMPKRYLDVLEKFAGVIAPDFSLYLDMPRAMQIYNQYRNLAIASYLQNNGITVIPNISWSDVSSYDWCFEGQPQNSVVALSTNGCINNYSLLHFLDGFAEMQKRLNPSKIIIYGKIPDELQNEPNIIHFASKLETIKTITKEK